MKFPVICLLCFLLSSCADPASISTPDIARLALGNIQAQKTLEAMQATSQVISANLTATAIFPTQIAIETSTERAWIVIGWTATASVKQTATSASGTATQQYIQSQATKQASDITATIESAAASARATEYHAQAVGYELAIERERMMNKVQAVSPWFLLFSLPVFFLFMIYRRSKVRAILRDERGDAPLLVINDSIYDVDRNPQSLLDYSGKKPSIPLLTSPGIQAATTERDQMIDLATRGVLDSPTPQRQEIAQKFISERVSTSIQVISPTQARPLLGNAMKGIVQDAIDADFTFEEGEQND